MMQNIRKKDIVVVTRGEYKGRRGRILEVRRSEGRVLVEGVNMMKRHTKPTSRSQAGGIVEREAPIHVSNVKPWCEAANAPSRIVVKKLEDGKRVRVWEINGLAVD